MPEITEIINSQVGAEAARLRDEFGRAKPFRHLCIDGFFTTGAAAQALADFPSFKAENAVNEFGVVGGKAVETKLASVSPFYKELYECMSSQPFLDVMSEITGIPDLLPDAKLFGGGTHENRDGQELDPHVDFNRMEDLSAYRRLNLLLYLNPEWKAEWGGSIELHSDPHDPETNQISSFEPLFNRAVIFETNEISWHGFPKIRLPENKKHLSRKSISIYLYTKNRPAEEIVAPHATFYVQRPLPEHLVSGYTLAPGDVAELKEAIAKRDLWIALYQKQELTLNEQIQGGRKFLEEVLNSLYAPILGFGIQEGKLDGLYHDRWVAPRLALAVQPKRPVTRVTVHGWVPDDMPAGGQLTLHACARVAMMDLVPGTFALSIEIPEGTEAAIPMTVEATEWVMPEGPTGRTLAFVLQGLELGHPN
jgi:Rps23 Pro-64 3,4-dihydroxylase Tpa1-like proline 4-hydroxylase